MNSAFTRLLRDILGENPTPATLVTALSHDGFLAYSASGFTDRQVRLAIIEQLARTGDDSAIDILAVHEKAYSKFGDQLVAEAAANAIAAIKARQHSDSDPAKGILGTHAQNPQTSCSSDESATTSRYDEFPRHTMAGFLPDQLQQALLRLDEISGTELPSQESLVGGEPDTKRGAANLIEILDEIDCDREIVARAKESLCPDSGNIDLWIGLAIALRENGNFHGALETYNTAIRHFPPEMSYKLFSNRGLLLLCWERYHEAIQSLCVALNLKPDYSYARFFLGQAYEYMHRYTEAIPHYRRVIEADTSDYNAWSNLGICQWQAGDRSEAETSFKDAIGINPLHADALYNLAGLYCESERFTMAQHYVELLLNVIPGDAGAKRLREKILSHRRHDCQVRDTFHPRTLVRFGGAVAPKTRLLTRAFSGATYRILSPVNFAVDEKATDEGELDRSLSGTPSARATPDATDTGCEDVLFLSYKWENADHCGWVIRLATDLENRGYKVIFDRFESPDRWGGLAAHLSEDSAMKVRFWRLDRLGREVPAFVREVGSATVFVPILTEAYRRCVEPKRHGYLPHELGHEPWGAQLNANDGWVFDEWQLALRLLLHGRMRWRGIWRSGPVLPVPFSKGAVCDLRDEQNYDTGLDAYFPIGGGGRKLTSDIHLPSGPS